MRRVEFSSVLRRGQDAQGPTLAVEASPSWGGYLRLSDSAIESRVLVGSRRFLWSDAEWVGWLAPTRVVPAKTDWLAFSLATVTSLVSRDPSGVWVFAPGLGSHGGVLRVAPHGNAWDNPGPNNPHTIHLPFVTDAAQSDEIQDFLRQSAARAGVPFRQGRP